MKLNHKVRYGIASLMELSKSPGDFLDAEAIAERQCIPPAYAQKVLQSMGHARLVTAQKGLGYRLTRPLSEITALEVVEALTAPAPSDGPALGMGDAIERRINTALESVTLGDLAA